MITANTVFYYYGGISIQFLAAIIYFQSLNFIFWKYFHLIFLIASLTTNELQQTKKSIPIQNDCDQLSKQNIITA